MTSEELDQHWWSSKFNRWYDSRDRGRERVWQRGRKRSEKIDLYEKYKWRVRKVEFLEVVIVPEEKNRGGKDKGSILLADS